MASSLRDARATQPALLPRQRYDSGCDTTLSAVASLQSAALWDVTNVSFERCLICRFLLAPVEELFRNVFSRSQPAAAFHLVGYLISPRLLYVQDDQFIVWLLHLLHRWRRHPSADKEKTVEEEKKCNKTKCVAPVWSSKSWSPTTRGCCSLCLFMMQPL